MLVDSMIQEERSGYHGSIAYGARYVNNKIAISGLTVGIYDVLFFTGSTLLICVSCQCLPVVRINTAYLASM